MPAFADAQRLHGLAQLKDASLGQPYGAGGMQMQDALEMREIGRAEVKFLGAR